MFQNSRNSRHFSSSKLFRQLISIPIIVYEGEGENINILSKNKIHFLPSLLYYVFKHENELKIMLAPKIRIVVMTFRTCADVIQPCRLNIAFMYRWPSPRRYSSRSRAGEEFMWLLSTGNEETDKEKNMADSSAQDKSVSIFLVILRMS